jgi:hypothetical protein
LITAVFESGEVTVKSGMIDRLATEVFFQVGLGDVGAEATAVMDEDVIPWLLAGRLGLVGVVPCFACHAVQVDSDNNPPIAVVLMYHDYA